MVKQLHAVIRGRVQMVGFRYFVVEEAQALGLTGWVRNSDDGETVEVMAEGPEERLERLEAALRDGPRHALVEAVDARWSDTLDGYEGFEVRW
jgi:acylphosphatase